MNKTREFEIQEAYVQGYNDAAKELKEAADAVDEWMARPEWAMVQAMNRFVKDLSLEMTGQKVFKVSK